MHVVVVGAIYIVFYANMPHPFVALTFRDDRIYIGKFVSFSIGRVGLVVVAVAVGQEYQQY